MAARTFEDSTGALWEVFEVHRASSKPAAVSPGMERGWLAFVSGSMKRRLAPFPPEWETASPAELERLCAGARVAMQPRIAGAAPRNRARRRDGAPAQPDPAASAHLTDAQSVEQAVRAFAHEARVTGVPAIEAMMRLKTLLLASHPGPDSEARDKRRVRRWFVETYYFERDA